MIGIVALVPAPLAAQALSTGAQGCTLHVWPSANAKSSYAGWFHGGAVDGDRRGIKGYPAMHADVLNTNAQQQLLTAMNWPDLLNRRGLTVVVHEQPPAAEDDLARTRPLIAAPPGCYEELIVHSVLVERAAFSSTSVRVMIIAKTWKSPGTTPRTYSAMANEQVNFDTQDGDVIGRSLKTGFVESVRKTLMSSYFQQH